MDTTEELEKYRVEMSRKRRIQQQALAILTRAKEAGIPQDMMRIPEKTFFELLDTGYFADNYQMNKKQLEEYCHALFTTPDMLMKKSFILIDGGDLYSRNKAGFALLFRMIAWDNNAKYYFYAKMAHQLQSWDTGQGISRNSLAEDLKNYDTMFVGEYLPDLAKASWDTGGFLDEIFAERDAEGLPTILSFINVLPARSMAGEGAIAQAISNLK